MGAFTMTDCRAAFISTGAGSFVCAELSGGESSILLSRKNPALSVGEVKERHVKHEHRVVNFGQRRKILRVEEWQPNVWAFQHPLIALAPLNGKFYVLCTFANRVNQIDLGAK
jgi:hypothetical protein